MLPRDAVRWLRRSVWTYKRLVSSLCVPRALPQWVVFSNSCLVFNAADMDAPFHLRRFFVCELRDNGAYCRLLRRSAVRC